MVADLVDDDPRRPIDTSKAKMIHFPMEVRPLLTAHCACFGYRSRVAQRLHFLFVAFRFDLRQRGIAGSVATTGETINIADAYLDERFNKAMDIKVG